MRTDIIIVLDRSGSMQSAKNDTIGGFNEFLRKQQEVIPEARLTFVQFDNEYEVRVLRGAVKDIAPLTDDSYSPRGTTALFDAKGRTINTLGEIFSRLPHDEKPERVVFMTITDGLENASKEFNSDQIRALVKEQSDKWKWEFVYLGADHDAYYQAGNLGLVTDNIVRNTRSNTRAAWQMSANKVASYAKGVDDNGEAVMSMAYSAQEKASLEQDPQ